MTDVRYSAAAMVLGEMVAGLAYARGRDATSTIADLSADELERIGEHGVGVTITLASGDRFRLTIEWLEAESP